jgi:uncharacterized membrane protein YjjP (DUF1212 family)
LASDNLNGVLFLAGFVSLVSGIGAWSVPLAAVVAGVVVMGMAAFPYLRKRGS